MSTSGIPHHDVGNYTKSRFWHDDLPRGINRTWRRAIDITIGQIASENPDALFHTGDMVGGDRLWRLLEHHDVDLLLSGEFHELTTHSDGGTTPVQVVHGGQLYRGNVNYLVINAFKNRMELQLKQMRGRPTAANEIWTPTRPWSINGVRMHRGARVVGTMTIHDDGNLSDRTGYMTEGM